MTEEIKQFIKDNYDNNTLVELSKLLKEKMNFDITPKRLSRVCKKMNLSKLIMNVNLKSDEVFKIVPGFENYEISQYGNLRNIKNRNYIKILTDKYGYHTVKITDNNNIKRNIPLHRVIAWVWIPNDDPENKIEVDHIDGIKTNNDLSNLEWVTPEENIKRARKNKLNKSNPHQNQVLSKEKIIDIYKKCLNSEKINYAEIGRIFSVSPNTVKRIWTQERYKNITENIKK